MRQRPRALRCHMCHQFPSTVAIYGDALSPRDPTLYCGICHELLHGADAQTVPGDYLKVVPQEEGDYFRC